MEGLVNMIYVDISEHKKVIEKCKKKMGKQFGGIKELGTYDCSEKLCPLEMNSKVDCIDENKATSLIGIGYKVMKDNCKSCVKATYVRFADFEIAPERAFYERKTASDFIASRRDRLLDQMTRMDTHIESRKGLILEGMPKMVKLQDSVFRVAKDKIESFNSLSPLQQANKIGGNDNWNLSFIRELKARNMEFVQTWNLDETIDFLMQCDIGYDSEPKIRFVPKRYPELPLERKLLVVFKGIGKVRSEKILKNHPEIDHIVKQLIKKVKKLGYDKV